MKYEYIPKGVCTRRIITEIDDDGIITNVEFVGGCAGNTTGVATLVKGRTAKEVVELLADVQCGARGTSCPAQLAIALQEALQEIVV